MTASDIDLDTIFRLALTTRQLATMLSFVQVEHGLDELRGHWSGFSDASTHFNKTFNDEQDCAECFGLSLADFYEFSELLPN